MTTPDAATNPLRHAAWLMRDRAENSPAGREIFNAGLAPAVALAVADWLDAEASTFRADTVSRPNAFAVARAYLGEPE